MKTIKISAGDRLLVKTTGQFPKDAVDDLKRALGKAIPEIDGRIAVIGGDLELTVLRFD